MTPNPQEFEAAIIRALDRQPEPVIPADFAARVARALPAPQPVRQRLQVGRTAASVAAAILVVASFAVAPHTAPSFTSLAFDVELLLVAQLGAIAFWLARSPDRTR